MEFFRIKKDIAFMRYTLIFNAISISMFIVAIFFLWNKGLHLSVEFTGGTLMEISYSKIPNLNSIRNSIKNLGFTDIQVHSFGTAQDIIIRLPVIRHNMTITQQSDKILNVLKIEDPNIQLKRIECIGPQIGDEMVHDSLIALIVVIVGILCYLTIRFQWKFALAAIIANLHDIIIILGFFAFFQWEFSLSVLTAVLAVLGYSINESVVVFDRAREAFRNYRYDTKSVPEILNHAITKTISRTIITHGSTEIMILSMLFFGGEALHYFSIALTIGIIFSIYSSVFVAIAIVMWLGIKREDLVKLIKSNNKIDNITI